ncbi:uncharacterized protein LOC122249351 [Penaeus japonicus]|uniref:uncharacterized protein LOC122249351 n=1 Tax=Penaeus japonicus TaxID=27405 RepID=UPI001C71068D|nr:uncharacterized protein LOC122249351 [Penaeus japonicus]
MQLELGGIKSKETSLPRRPSCCRVGGSASGKALAVTRGLGECATGLGMTHFALCLAQVVVVAGFGATSSITITARNDRRIVYPQATTESANIFDHEDEIPTTLHPASSPRRDCSTPYIRIAGQCLSIRIMFNVTWEGARGFCRALDGDLVVAASFQDLLLAYLDAYASSARTYRRSQWIGARRADALSSFQWLDGSDLPPLASPAWDYQDDDSYNCVSLELDHSDTYRFRNADCKAGNTVICQCLACEL